MNEFLEEKTLELELKIENDLARQKRKGSWMVWVESTLERKSWYVWGSDWCDAKRERMEWYEVGRVSWNHICEGSKNYDLELKAL